MNRDECPSRVELEQYATGTLCERRAESLEEHVQWCAACAETMNAVDSCTDKFLVKLREQSLESDDSLSEAEYLRAIDSICQPKFLETTLDEIRQSAWRSVPYSQFQPGDRLGQYELLEVLGRGGIGVVFKARHLRLNKTVALKVLNASAIDDPTRQQRFEREMHAIGQLDHPNVVGATDAADIDGVHFLAMEYVSGSDLSKLLSRNGPFPIADACEFARQAAIGLHHIALSGIVHRDLKPGNLMLTDDGQIKILDLGLALLNESSPFCEQELTDVGQLMGTLDYMAPEQGRDTHDVDIRADIYSLGATLFALLAGHPPFSGKRYPTLRKKLDALANDPVPEITTRRAGVPIELSRIVTRMMDRDPDKRFQTPKEVANVLLPFCQRTDASRSQDCYNRGDSGDSVDDSARAESSKSQSHSSFLTGLRRDLPGKNGILVGIAAVAAISISIAGFTELKQKNSPSIYPAVTSIESSSESRSPGVEVTMPDAVEVNSRLPLMELAKPINAATIQSDVDSAWTLFSDRTAPDLRTDAIHQAVEVVPVDVLLTRLRIEPDTSTRAGLLLALSEYDAEMTCEAAHLMNPEPFDLLSMLHHWYVKDPDSEVHSGIEYLLQSWQKSERLLELRPLIEQKLIPFDGGWYQPFHVSSMVVIPGPMTVQLGSPETEYGRFNTPDQDERLRTITIPYTFALCSTEVTRYQRWRIGDRYWEIPEPSNPAGPANNISWQEAAQFCNRLSQLEGLRPVDYCYETYDTDQGVRLREKPNAVELTGYRLPTDDEWEIACRAGTTTMRPEGNESKLWKEYVYTSDASQPQPNVVRSRKPNPLGLFDMIGNVAEWTQTPDVDRDTGRLSWRLRGGSVWTQTSGLRSAARFLYERNAATPKVGFRVARTLIRKPFALTESDKPSERIELLVGPPACPNELMEFIDSEFQSVRNQQIIRVGHWNVRNVQTRRFRLQNNGSEPVRMPELPSMTGLFEFEGEPTLEIAPNSYSEFGVRMTVLSVGERSHRVKFRFDGLVADALPPLKVHGCLNGTLLSVFNVGVFGQTPKTADLGNVPRDATVGIRFYMWNLGNTFPEARVTGVTGPFKLTHQLEGPIVNLDNSFRIALDATTLGVAEGTVSLTLIEDESVQWTFPVKAVVAENRPYCQIGIFRNGTWLIDFDRDTVPDEVIEFGKPGDRPLTGDWNGDGICDIAVWSTGLDGLPVVQLMLRGEKPQPPLTQSEFKLKRTNQFPVAIDFDNDGRTDLGAVSTAPDGEHLVWAFDTAHDGTFQDAFAFGRQGDSCIVGDWNGDGVEEVAVSRCVGPTNPLERIWEFRFPGANPRRFASTLDFPIAGDWDGDGDDDLGGWRPLPRSKSSFWQFESDGDTQPNSDLEGFGIDTDIPFVLK